MYRSARVFFSRTDFQEGGEVDGTKNDIKAMKLELVLLDYLDDTGAMIMKMDQVSGWGEMCGINLWGQEMVGSLV